MSELARLFAWLSLTSFGGPAAHIALMRRELVERRGWLTDAEFLDIVGASNVIPGPTSTEVAIYVGRRRRGAVGMITAGVAFIAPAALVVGILAWFYVRYGTRPAVGDLFDGIKPVVVAIVAIAVVQLGRTAVKSRPLGLLAVAVFVLYLAGVNEPVLLLAASALAAVVTRWPGVAMFSFMAALLLAAPGRWPRPGLALASITAALPLAQPGSRPPRAGLPEIFSVFLKIGALLFGSGYVLLAFLRRDLVLSHQWLTEAQLIDAIAVGQFTPGPLFTTATFVGYVLRGFPGAVVATFAIFLPSFLMVAALEPVVTRLRRSATAGAALDGINAAAIALMAGVTWFLGQEAIVDVPTALLAAAAAVALVRYRVNPVWLIGLGALYGLLRPG
jgi:chromate transporter